MVSILSVSARTNAHNARTASEMSEALIILGVGRSSGMRAMRERERCERDVATKRLPPSPATPRDRETATPLHRCPPPNNHHHATTMLTDLLLIVLLVAVALLIREVWLWLAPARPPPPPRAAAPPKPKLPFRSYSPDELREFDGSDASKPVLLAIDGRVFDVSGSSMYRKPDGAYSVFAGHDATVCLATGSLSADDLDRPTSDLAPGDRSNLNDWIQFYEGKYDVVGDLTGNEQEPPRSTAVAK